jgi:hypothetical protein
MTEGNLAYYARRARQEAEAAAAAAQPGIAYAHRLLALQYEDRVRELRIGSARTKSATSVETIDG